MCGGDGGDGGGGRTYLLESILTLYTHSHLSSQSLTTTRTYELVILEINISIEIPYIKYY